MVENETTFVLESQSASNVSADGSAFSVFFDAPIQVPIGAQFCKTSVLQANIWYNWPNIVDQAIYLAQVDLTTGVISYHILVFPVGLYDVCSINDMLQELLAALGLSPTLLQFLPDGVSSNFVIHFESEYDSIYFVAPDTTGFEVGGQPEAVLSANSLQVILGFINQPENSPGVVFIGGEPDPGVYPLTETANFVTGTEIAKLNQVNKVLVHADFVGAGIPVNNIGSGVVASIPLQNALPFQLIHYEPFHLATASTPHLAGALLQNVRIYVTNENNVPLNTLGESYSLTMKISWVE